MQNLQGMHHLWNDVFGAAMFSSCPMHSFSLDRFDFISGVRVHVHRSLMHEIQETPSTGCTKDIKLCLL